MSENEKDIEQSREKAFKSLQDRVDRMKGQGYSKEGMKFDLDRVMSRTALTFLMAGGGIREVVQEFTLAIEQADKVLGEVED